MLVRKAEHVITDPAKNRLAETDTLALPRIPILNTILAFCVLVKVTESLLESDVSFFVKNIMPITGSTNAEVG